MSVSDIGAVGFQLLKQLGEARVDGLVDHGIVERPKLPPETAAGEFIEDGRLRLNRNGLEREGSGAGRGLGHHQEINLALFNGKRIRRFLAQ